MPLPVVFPDPKSASVNNPCKLVSPKDVLRLYNKILENSEKELVVTNDVKKWFGRYARDSGWTSVNWYGNQCLLIANISVQEDT